MTSWSRSLVVAGWLLAGGLGPGCAPADEPVFGPSTESTCPPASPLTYANFGQPFMAGYCTRCHSSDLVGAARQGAPSFHDFDTLFGVKAVSDHIDQTTAAGPVGVNDGMPRGSQTPTLMERYQLGEWIACGMPE